MDWLRQRVRRWLANSDSKRLEEPNLTAVPYDFDRGRSKVSFEVMSASNGYVVTGNRFNPRTDRFEIVSRVCPEGSDIVPEIVAVLAEIKLR
jgi:hypothetical protein